MVLGKTGRGLHLPLRWGIFVLVTKRKAKTMHLHTLRLVPLSIRVECEGCDVALRLATRNEAIFVQTTNGYEDDGPMLGPTNVVVVPVDFSLYQEA